MDRSQGRITFPSVTLPGKYATLCSGFYPIMNLIKQLEELEANVSRTMAENEDLKAKQDKWQVKKTALENANAEFALAFAEKEKELVEAKAALDACRAELGAFKDREAAWTERLPKILARLSGSAETKAPADSKIIPLVPTPAPNGKSNGAVQEKTGARA